MPTRQPKFDDKIVPLRRDPDRWRLDFGKVTQFCPELGHRTKFLRTRTKKLRNSFLEDAQYVKEKFQQHTIVAVGVALILVAVAIVLQGQDVGLSAAVLAGFSAAGALVFGVANSTGLHRQYEAMMAARWAMEGLVTKIENHVLQLSLNIGQSGELSVQQREELLGALEEWSTELEVLLQSYGRGSGSALKPVEMPTLASVKDGK